MSQGDDFESPSTNNFVDAVSTQPAEDNASAEAQDKSGDNSTNANEVNDQANIFQDLAFFVAQEDLRQELEPLIELHGGKVLKELPSGQSSKEFVVSPTNTADLPTVTSAYVRECCATRVLLKLGRFLVPYSGLNTETQPSGYNGDDSGTGNSPAMYPITEKSGESDSRTNVKKSVTASSSPKKAQPASGVATIKLNVSKPECDPANSSLGDETGVQVSNGPKQATTSTTGSTSLPHRPALPQATENAAVKAKDEDEHSKQRYVAAQNKANFTSEEDNFILEVVRKNPSRRTTHTLFDEISRFVPAHTGNSIRHRYRAYLAKRLDFVYEVDDQGRLVRDENGELIKTTVLPKSLKNKFIASEDYDLALNIKRQFYRDLYQVDPETGKSLIENGDSPSEAARRAITMEANVEPGSEPSLEAFRVGERRGPVPREFFKLYTQRNPTHTENAWRDRFRKFLLTYGIDRYIEYYEHEVAQDRVPEAMKNLTNRPKRPGERTPGNYSSQPKKIKLPDNEQAAEEQSSNISQRTKTVAKGSKPSKTDPSGISDADLLDEETLNFITGLRRDLSKIESAGGTAFEYPQEIAESIRNDFTNEESQFDNIDPDTFSFPPPLASNDLFMPNFFRLNSTRKFVDKINEIISRDYEASQAEKLVQDLCEEAGVRKTFSTSILTALSGDLMVFPRYFLCMFSMKANPPLNVPGIWTRDDDEALRRGTEEDVKKLTEKHGSGRIEMRKRFIASDLV
ncbi:LADA_0G06634g1_1 [Lachancea dasiensis]|uniref:DNA-binding protein RAP1 n=1 Tax=Lachancea dasiensis TaxID=1072105 RepID=A0A1G4JT91_9SACH|nr:LADA_0G06634g1_1 [Lachancea dasiensis]